MEQKIIHYEYPTDVIVFRDSLQDHAPCIFEVPRNHESLFFVTNGTLLYEKAGVRETVETGQVGYISRGSVDKSSAFSCPEVSYIAINFHFDRCSPSPSPTLPFPTLCATDRQNRFEKLFNHALQNFLSKTTGNELICGGLVMQIIGSIFEERSRENRDFAKRRQLEKAVEYMKMHCGDAQLKIGQGACLLGMSERNFRRQFMAAYHQSPYAFLQELRIEKAGILLTNTTKSLGDIAVQCGFSDLYSFSHCFKKHMGVSPSKYREHL
ncbi:MAG: helix-turn-helix transcriptional regulator [Clostridia bacterium]|nr:helix-turn-helix transcriptional regulator [Clostridia bacterium]